MIENSMEKLVTFIRGGEEVMAASESDAECVLTDKLPINHSCELREDKKTPYRTALYVTKDGIVPDSSASGAETPKASPRPMAMSL